jgi:FixJ family two-component response regulator
MAGGVAALYCADQCWRQRLRDKITISIVDDDESFREGLAALMSSHGFDTEAFDSGSSFLDSTRPAHTDCLISDVQMPGMNGLELLERLAELGRSVPTILITARHDEVLRARALRSGVRCYLHKPFDEDELLRCIHSALEGPGVTPC